MRTLILVSLVCLLMGPVVVCAESWNKIDKALAGTFIVGQAINYGQIRYAVSEPGWHEINPLIDNIHDRFGTSGLVGWKVGTTALLLGAAQYFPKLRRTFLIGGNVIVWGLVGHDIAVGVGWRW